MQEKIIDDMRKVYSEKVIELFLHPKNVGEIKDAEGYGKFTGPCGDTMEIYLKIKDDTIYDAKFMTDGCGTTIACGSVATELAQKKTFVQALASVSADEILKKLGGLPESDIHCAELAAETLRRALADYLYQKRAPWKKPFR